MRMMFSSGGRVREALKDVVVLAFWVLFLVLAGATLSSCSIINCRNELHHDAGTPRRCWVERQCANGSRHWLHDVKCEGDQR